MEPRALDGRSIRTDTDPVTIEDLRAMANATGPCVTLHLPTHRRGADVRQDPVRLRNLLDDAAHRLRDAEIDAATADAVLAPVRALLDDTAFWQHQADGLSVFAAPGFHRWFRLDLELRESVAVGEAFHVAPLVPLLSGDGSFLVLALSQHQVRLYEATRSSMVELDTGDMPTSIDEALEHEDHERQLQLRSAGSGAGDAQFHGHGAGDEYDKATVERFLRIIDHGLHDILGADDRPLVLACVAYYVPIFSSICRNHRLVTPAIEGNPDHARPADLHAEAWGRVAPMFVAGAERAGERYQVAAAKGAAVDHPFDVADRAVEGRVDTLLVDPDAANHVDPFVDRAILATITTSGQVLAAVPGSLPPGAAAGAILRY